MVACALQACSYAWPGPISHQAAGCSIAHVVSARLQLLGAAGSVVRRGRGAKKAWCAGVCRMSRELPEAEFGPHVGFREWSLLGNPRAGVKDGDVLTVHVCQVQPHAEDRAESYWRLAVVAYVPAGLTPTT